MARYGMVMDVSKCSGCYNCQIACKDEHCGQEYAGYTAAQPMTGQFWLKLFEKERGQFPKVKVAYTALMCQHCQNAPCVKAAENGAVYRRADGIVIIDPVKAKGQKQIVNACPYRVIYWNEQENLPQKCTLCAHLLDSGWKEPRCVENCPAGALTFGDLDNPESEAAKLVAAGKTESYHAEYGLKENVLYLNLPRRFIAGTVVFGDTDECAGGVTVSLKGAGEEKTSTTNSFGDFEFEGLPADKDCTLYIKHPGYQSQEIKARTTIDNYLGNIILNKK
jgi:Fe-S-cluster-containing dehydrogenase component